MEKFKKILAVVLGAVMMFSVCVPAFAAEGDLPAEETVTEETETPDGGEVIPEEETPEGETDEVIPEEEVIEEDKYLDVLRHCVSEGTHNLVAGLLLMGAAVCSPLLTLVFFPIGIAAGLGGLPLGALSFVVGLGEIVASPVISLFIDTDTILAVI